MDDTEKYIAAEEGYRQFPYRCTAGKLTIGYGFNLDDTGLSEPESAAILHMRLGVLRTILVKYLPWFPALNEARQAALLSMAYQMGVLGLMGFTTTMRLLADGQWEEASRQMLNSRWATKQTPERARRTAYMVRYGIFPNPSW